MFKSFLFQFTRLLLYLNPAIAVRFFYTLQLVPKNAYAVPPVVIRAPDLPDPGDLPTSKG